MKTRHKIIFGDAGNMKEVEDGSVDLVVTSPPYYNAPFDYPDLFEDYNQFLHKMREIAKELKRVVAKGRIVCIVCDDTLIDGEKYPVVADLTKIYIKEGFKYRDKIIWIKPEGYIRISRRSGVLLQHPYPMYFYPDNIQETILIFQNGKFDYKSISSEIKEESKIDVKEYQKNKWYLTTWHITNVLPIKNRLEEGIAAFPEEIPYRLIKLFSYKGETVLDPFMGSGTTNKVAAFLGRNSIGYEIDLELEEIVKEKLQIKQSSLFERDYEVEFIKREDAKHLRRFLQEKLKNNKSVVKNAKRNATRIV
ncbi:MAG: site-specific DNA-methyltransferase [Thermoplasmata archaeon]|nr:MAG: site-specific DNA-methyltransferase [Thermoplasmata archaeon]KAA0009281.1 MAG: site-specific DNA-methyltransferase [Thermoplasmata archaeon]